MSNDKYILEDGAGDAGLWYSANLLTTPATLQGSTFTGGLLVRKVLGVTNGVAALRITEDELLYDFDFTLSDGDWFAVVNHLDLTPSALTGVYDPGDGWRKSGIDPGGGGVDTCRIAYDMGANVYLTRIVGTFTATGPDDANDVARIDSCPDGSLSESDPTIANTGGTLDTGTVAAAPERYLYMEVANDYAAGTMAITEFQAYGQLLKFRYSADNGATNTETTVGSYAGDTGMDTDDFNVGVKIVAAANRIYYGSSYTGAFAELTGLTGVAAGTQITCVRIPYRKLATQALNNNASSIQFIFGTGAAVSGKTLWGITFNASSGAIVGTPSNMTPVIDGITYYVIGAHALETYGNNTQRIVALCKPVGGGDTHLLSSINGGGSWSDLGAADYTRVHFVDPAVGGNGAVITLAGGAGVAVSVNLGSTLQDKIGDFVAELSSDDPLGAVVF